MTPSKNATQKIPQATSSDADVTQELTTTRLAALVQNDPVIKTEELTASDILEVHNAVRAMQAAEIAAASPDRTSEIDALDILEAESIAAEPVVAKPIVIEPERLTFPLPKTSLPPRRANEPTRIIHRDLMARMKRALAEKRSRSIMMLAAALGTWAFFASFAIVGVYGVTKIAKHFSSKDAPTLATIAPASRPAADENAQPQQSEELAPLLSVEANQLARVSTTDENASADDSAPRVSITSSQEIFRRPSKTQVGVLRVSSSVKGLLVDGTPERVTGGSLILACGDHRIRQPHSTARVVRVPCGKTVAL